MSHLPSTLNVLTDSLSPLSNSVSPELAQALPKVVLHDHLDGGLRPVTMLEFAREIGYTDLPAAEPEHLKRWFVEAADSGSLEKYLQTFGHTVALLQTAAALERVAFECGTDLAEDNVVYAEVRYAPEQHIKGVSSNHLPLTLSEVVEAVNRGFDRAMKENVHPDGSPKIIVKSILCAMRHTQKSLDIAQLVVQYRDQGVVGFDIAGPEEGFPPSNHGPAFSYLHQNHANVTVHAGEAAGIESIHEALFYGHAHRLGHGVRVLEGLQTAADDRKIGGHDQVAPFVRDHRIPLEVCPSSNTQTGICPTISEHPVRKLIEAGFTVTINTDNRLMSGTSMSREFELLGKYHDFTVGDMYQCTVNGVRSAFIPYHEQQRILHEIITPQYLYLPTAEENSPES